ncbi:MAG: hypothetical protein LBH42_09225 [Treponema sp.]|jgi:DNA repair exonuclease SbcCD ATPase subunit|nr:hypothetical protein [Treponema sp.]
MGFFTVGNIITLGIVVLVLILYRQLDRYSRTLNRLKDFSEDLKKKLSDFVGKEEQAVKDYIISLNVERDSAKELMKHLQVTAEELAEKAASINRIDTQIKAYEDSLAQLDLMTARVQENMSRVRDESAFVETAARKISEAKNKLLDVEKALGSLENKFATENSQSLEKTAASLVAEVKSIVSDLGATAETIERKVEDHREAINKLEETRAANIARDKEFIDKILLKSVEQAGIRADKMEEAALVKLKEQAEDRIIKLKAAEEEKLKAYHESAKARVAEVQNLVKNIRDEWKTERGEWETKDKDYRDERRKDIHELSVMLDNSEKRFIMTQDVMEKNFTTAQDAMEKRFATAQDSVEKRFNADRAALEKQMEELSIRSNETVRAQEAKLLAVTEGMMQKSLEITGKKLDEYREKSRAERSDWEIKDKTYRDEREKGMHELNTLLTGLEKRFAVAQDAMEKRLEENIAAFEKQSNELSVRSGEIVRSQETLLLKATEEMKQKSLEISGAKLEEYRRAQEAEFRRLETLADDSRNLDAELRKSMQEVVGKIRSDFSKFEQESANMRKTEADKFSSSVLDLNKELTGLEREIASLKSATYEDVSGKLKSFENEFFADLTRRSGDIDRQLVTWQDKLDTRLDNMGEEAVNGRLELERSYKEELKNSYSSLNTRNASGFERLKSEIGAFEEGMRGKMSAADESVASFMEQLNQNLAETRKDAEISIKSEIGKYYITSSETAKRYHRDLEDAGEAHAKKIKEMDGVIEEVRRRVRDLGSETDTRIASARTSIEDTERHISEAVDKTKLIDEAEKLKLNMERQIEDLKGEIDRLDQRRLEVARLENDFVKINQLGNEVNSKMTRFINEQLRIEKMEMEFTRLLQISRSVEEKLTQVTASDDTLQGMQLQIRKLEEALSSTEDKYQRVERKNQILDNTNDGIDRNFKLLQESEKISGKIGEELDRYAEDIEFLKTSMEKLAAESEKVKDTEDRLGELKDLLEEIEERINSMQRARAWIAEAETRLEALNKQAQIQARAVDGLVKGKKSGPIVEPGEKNLSSQQLRENVIALVKQGWKDEEIAKMYSISVGAVQLIREMAPMD